MAASLAWGGHQNGFIPSEALVDVGRGFLLEAGTARQFNGARAELLHACGIDILDYVSDTYRDYAGQVYQKARWTALGKPWNAATPGGSIHGWAKAIDTNADALYKDGIYDIVWEVLERYGFIRDVDGENWHGSFRENQVTTWADPNSPITAKDWFDMASNEDLDRVVEARTKPVLDKVSAVDNKVDTILNATIIEAGIADDVNRLYQEALGRLADPGALQMFIGLLKGGWTEDQVFASLIASDEYANNYVRNLYNDLLGRGPSDSDIEFWRGVYRNAGTFDAVANGIRSSQEYRESHPNG